MRVSEVFTSGLPTTDRDRDHDRDDRRRHGHWENDRDRFGRWHRQWRWDRW